MLGSEDEVPVATMDRTMPRGGGLSPLNWGIFDPSRFYLAGEKLLQADMRLGVGGGFWGQICHPGGRSLKLPPMPEKLIPTQVDPLGAWSIGSVGPGACII